MKNVFLTIVFLFSIATVIASNHKENDYRVVNSIENNFQQNNQDVFKLLNNTYVVDNDNVLNELINDSTSLTTEDGDTFPCYWRDCVYIHGVKYCTEWYYTDDCESIMQQE